LTAASDGCQDADQAIARLARLARKIGRQPLEAPAAGGNVSVKLGPEVLAVKQSGLRLRDLYPDRGWTYAHRSRLNAILRATPWRKLPPLLRETTYADAVRDTGLYPGGLASLEAGLHVLLPQRFVVHTHSLAAILLGMQDRAESQALISSCLGGGIRVRFLPPVLPGLDLALRIEAALDAGTQKGAALWVLANHGLIWACDSLWELGMARAVFEDFFRSYFGLRGYSLPHPLGAPGCRDRKGALGADLPGTRILCLCRWPRCHFDLRPLFPDFAAYFGSEAGTAGLHQVSERAVRVPATNGGRFEDCRELFYAHALASTIAAGLGVLKPLPFRLAQGVAVLESERRRLKGWRREAS